jgi:hypothetical protein
VLSDGSPDGSSAGVSVGVSLEVSDGVSLGVLVAYGSVALSSPPEAQAESPPTSTRAARPLRPAMPAGRRPGRRPSEGPGAVEEVCMVLRR